MKKLLLILLALTLLTGCGSLPLGKGNEKGPIEGQSGEKDKKTDMQGIEGKMEAVYLADDLFYFRKSDGSIEENDLIRLKLKDGSLKPVMGEVAAFDQVGNILETYPAQTEVEKAAVLNGKAMGLKADINRLDAFRDYLGDRAVIVDVRTKEEFDEGHFKGAVLSPLDMIESDHGALAKDKVVVVYCRSGNRSAQAQEILERLGYFVIDAGGISGYKGELAK